MKRVNKLSLMISFVLVLAAYSWLSISASAENLRWTLESMNPWSGIEALAFVVSYLIDSGSFTSHSISIALFAVLWLGVYLLAARIARGLGR